MNSNSTPNTTELIGVGRGQPTFGQKMKGAVHVAHGVAAKGRGKILEATHCEVKPIGLPGQEELGKIEVVQGKAKMHGGPIPNGDIHAEGISAEFGGPNQYLKRVQE